MTNVIKFPDSLSSLQKEYVDYATLEYRLERAIISLYSYDPKLAMHIENLTVPENQDTE
jgi:hypothetical protein